VYGFVGDLGVHAGPLPPALEAACRDESGWARVAAAESIPRVGGRTEDTLPVIAAHSVIEDGCYTALHAEAVRIPADTRVVPEQLVPGWRDFANSERRVVFDGSNDGTPHADSVARAAVRRLLETATVGPFPVADIGAEARAARPPFQPSPRHRHARRRRAAAVGRSARDAGGPSRPEVEGLLRRRPRT